jgi:hypothetical protein
MSSQTDDLVFGGGEFLPKKLYSLHSVTKIYDMSKCGTGAIITYIST